VGPTETSGYKFYVNSSKPILTLPNGLSDFDKNERIENEDPKNTEKFIISYSGEFEIKRKGLDTLIESFKLFSQEVNSPVALWLIGRGDDEVALQKLVQHHGLENKVKLFSNHDKRLTKSLIQQAHVFVQPSRVDCIPMTALTAASFGVPLIITEETNLCKFIRQYEAGWCLSKLDEENLKQALHEVYFIHQTDEIKAQTISRNSYRMIREELNWNALSKKWKEVYLSVS
jgi:glycosyltransferase involved in cell wall biosynthesis